MIPLGWIHPGLTSCTPQKRRVTQHDGWIQNGMMEILHGNLMESPENRHKHTRERERERYIYHRQEEGESLIYRF